MDRAQDQIEYIREFQALGELPKRVSERNTTFVDSIRNWREQNRQAEGG
tara:strand:+ start:1897 stop:2043 length:147 start_codon:yes stop_codon:yes gene_type:complete